MFNLEINLLFLIKPLRWIPGRKTINNNKEIIVIIKLPVIKSLLATLLASFWKIVMYVTIKPDPIKQNEKKYENIFLRTFTIE